jgi:hypothetical protein
VGQELEWVRIARLPNPDTLFARTRLTLFFYIHRYILATIALGSNNLMYVGVSGTPTAGVVYALNHEGAGLSQSPHTASAIAHTRPAKERLFPLTVYVIHVTRD